MEITIEKIQQINDLHDLVYSKIGKVYEHVGKLGGLLIEIKNSLPHGQFGDWVSKNLKVSQRQVQRYIECSSGKKMKLQELTCKSDTVSHLGKNQFVPEPGTISISVVTDEDGNPDIDCLVESCKQFPDFFFVTVYQNKDGHTIPLFTPRPVEADAVHAHLTYFGKENIVSSIINNQWRFKDGGVMEAGECVFGPSDNPPESVMPKLSPRKLIFSDGYSPELIDGKLKIDLTKTKIEGLEILSDNLG